LCLCFPSRQQAASVFDIENTYDFEIIQDDNGEGCLTLSVRRMELAKAWDRCREAQADDAALTGEVLSVNRGGLLVEVEKLRGFVPQSHIGVRTLNREELIGQQLPFKFIEVDEEKNRLVLSHRLATDMVSAEGLEVGDVVEGMVQAVKPYGAFVDVGGQSGLLHISQISHERIVAVENVLSPGDRIKVLVMSKDAERGRLSLSTKKLEQNHGDMLRNPAAVFETAEEMGRQFKEKMAAAEGGMVMSTDEE
jgi:small subunit ribosomal protein S1